MTRTEKIEKLISLHSHFCEKLRLYSDAAMQSKTPKHQEIHWSKYHKYYALSRRAEKLANKLLNPKI